MQTGIEAFLLIDLTLNAALLTVASKSAGCFRLRRVLISSILSTLFSLITFLRPDPLYSPVAQLILMIPVSMIAAGTCDIRMWGVVAALQIIGLMLGGGCERLVNDAAGARVPGILPMLASVLLFGLLLVHRKRRRTGWMCELCVSANGATVRFSALIDTGNRLREPLSGLPVIIAEESLITDIIPDSGFRCVAFGGLGGNGTLDCFRPDFIWIASGKRLRRAPDAYIGILPARLPGANRALLPVEFASL